MSDIDYANPPPDLTFGSPDELFVAYSAGFRGCIPDLDAWRRMLDRLDRPYFGAAAPDLAGSGEGKLSLLYPCVLHFDPAAYEERQTTGDCVSHAARNAADLSRAVEILVRGEPEEWVARGATEGIYGSRGHGGQGMHCAGAAEFLTEKAGLLLRRQYGGIDLSRYNGNLGAGWGSRGVPAELIEAGKKNPMRKKAAVRTLSEARDALANGYGMLVCSNYGFSDERDADGFARPRGNWGHAMAWSACDDQSKRPGILIQNSWGNWNRGPKRHGQPDGSFWIDYGVAEGMLRQGGALVVGEATGFPRRKLPDWATGTWL